MDQMDFKVGEDTNGTPCCPLAELNTLNFDRW